MVRLNEYPQLQFIAWNRPGTDVISDADAFALYERNWRFVDQLTLDAHERALIERLTNDVGHGHLHV